MTTRPHQHTERRRAQVFLLVFFLLAAGIASAGYLYYRDFAEHYRAVVERELATIGDQKVSELVQFRHEHRSDANVFFKNAAFSALVRRAFAAQPDVDAQRQLRVWLSIYNAAEEYDCVFLLDAAGRERVAVPAEAAPMGAVVSRAASEALRSHQIIFQDFYRDEHDRKVYLVILVPILDDTNAGQALGVLGLRIDPTVALYPAIKRWPIPRTTAESKLVRRDGNAVVYLNELRTRDSTPLTERVPVTETRRTAVMAVLGLEGIVYGVGESENPVVGYVRAVPDSPWFVVLREEIAEVYAPFREQLWLIWVVVTALVVGAGAGLGAIWRGESVRFYRERSAAAEALRQSEERYQHLFESNPYPAWVFDAETLSFLMVNQAAIEHYGYSRNEFLAMTIKDIRPAADLPRLSEYLAAPNRRAGKAGVWRHCKKDGTVIDVETNSSVVVHEGRRAELVIPIDITERQRVEAVLRERVTLNQLALEVGRAFASSASLPSALQGCCAALVRNLDAAIARIWTLEEGATVLELQASAGLYTHIDGPHRHVPVGQFKIGLIAEEKRPHLTNSVIGDPRVENQDWAKAEGMVAFAGHPLMVGDQIVGVMALFARHPLSGATLDALGSVATEIAFGIDQKRMEAERHRLVAELQDAAGRVKTLSGLVPICAWCKKIRDDGNYWHQVESYVSKHTDATFSHSMCPDCMKEHYPEFHDATSNQVEGQ